MSIEYPTASLVAACTEKEVWSTGTTTRAGVTSVIGVVTSVVAE